MSIFRSSAVRLVSAALLAAAPLSAKSYDGVITYHDEKWEPVESYTQIANAIYIQLVDPDQDNYDSLSISVQGGLQKERPEELYLQRVPDKKGVFRGVLPFDFTTGYPEVDGDLDIVINESNMQDTIFVTYIDLRSAAGITLPIISSVAVTQFDIRDAIEGQSFDAPVAATEPAPAGPSPVEKEMTGADSAAVPDSVARSADSAALVVERAVFAPGHKVQGRVSGAWEPSAGAYLATGDLTVPAGSTLVLMPGTRLLFEGHYRLNVNGRLEARGTEAKPVIFAGSGQEPQRGAWNGIFFEDSTSAGMLSHCRISHSYHGIYTYKADSLTVNNSVFRRNQFAAFVLNGQTGSMTIENNDIAESDYGIVCVDTCTVRIAGNRFKDIANHGINCEKGAAPLIEDNVISGSGAAGISCMIGSSPVIRRNVITENSTGISCMSSSPAVESNKITANRLAGIVCFGASSPRVNRNSLARNRLYDLKNETANNIDARGNWWGAFTTTQLKDGETDLKMIYDRQDNPALGSVDCSGFAGSPLGLGGDGSVKVHSLEVYEDHDCTKPWGDSTFIGDRVFLRVAAADIDPASRDQIGIRVYSVRTDPKGLMLMLDETGVSTGEYRGTFIMLNRTNALLNQIGASYGESVEIVVSNDTTRRVSLPINNRRPAVAGFRVTGAQDSLHLVAHAPTFTWRFHDEIAINVPRLVMFMDDDLKKKIINDLQTQVVRDPQRAVRLQVSATAGFGDILWDSGELPVADTQYTYAGDTLYNGRTYYVRLSASDGTLWSQWAVTRLRMNTPPQQPVLQTPQPNERVASLFPVLRVQTPEDAEGDTLFIEFEVAADSLFENRYVHYADIQASPSVTGVSVKRALTENARYFWRARARDSWETGEWSEAHAFFADAVSEVIRPFSLLHPDNEDIITSLTPTLLWEPTADPDPGEDITYTLYLSQDPSFKDGVTVVENLVKARYDVPEELADNKYYYWKVAARHANKVQFADQTGWWFFTNGRNDPPRLRAIPDVVFREDTRDSSLVLDPYVTDVDNEKDELRWTVRTTGSVSAVLDARTHRVTFAAPADWSGGPERVRFTVRDAGFDSASVEVNVIVEQVNDLPVVSRIPDIMMDEDGEATVDLDKYVHDVETPAGAMRWAYRNQWKFRITIDSANIAHIRPPQDWSGRLKKLMMTVRDRDGGEASTDFSIAVRPVNDAPVIDTLPIIVFREEGNYTVRLDDIVHDVDDGDDRITWRYRGNRRLLVAYDPDKRVLELKAPPNWFGVPETVYVTATDPAGASSEGVLRVKVSSVNDPPELAEIPTLTFKEDDTLALDLGRYVSDVDDAVGDLRWDIAGGKRVSVAVRADSVRAVLRAQADWAGEERLVFTVTDPQGASAQQRVRVIVTAVNDAPVAALDDTVRFDEDGTYLIKLDDFVSDADHEKRQLVWKAAGQRQVRVDIDPAIRRVTLSAPQDWFGGPENIRFTVTDPEGMRAVDSITVIVAPVNDVPVISGLVPSAFLEDKQLTLKLDDYVADVDNNREELVWSAAGQQGVIVTIDGALRTVTFTAPQDWNGGPERITLGARDPGGLTGTGVIPVTVTAVNDTPVMVQPADITFDEDGTAVLKLDDHIGDVDNRKDELQWVSAGQQQVHVAIDPATREAVFSAPRDWFGGPESVTFTATDPGGLSAARRLAVTVTPVNDVPVISGLPKGVFREDERLTFALDDFVSDVDNSKSELVWNAAGNDRIAVSIDPASRTISFSAPQNWNGGPEPIVLSARDPGGLTGTADIPMTVTPVNDAPVMTKPADITFDEDGRAVLVLDKHISDVDNRVEQIVWTAAGQRRVTVTIEPGTRNAVFTAPQDWYGGPETVRFTGTDPEGLSDSKEIRVTVTPVNDVPVITGPGSVAFDEDASLLINLDENVKDVDNAVEELTWRVTSGTDVSAVLDATARTLRLSAPADWNGGPQDVLLAVTDPGGLTAEAAVKVTVKPVNDAPVAAAPETRVIAEDGQETVNLDPFISDVDNADADIQWQAAGGSGVKAVIDMVRRTVTFSAEPDWFGGPETITLTGTDPGGLSAVTSIDVTFTAVNDAPRLKMPLTAVFDEDGSAVVALDKLVEDVDDAAATLIWDVAAGVNIRTEYDAAARSVRLSAPQDWNGGPESVRLTVTDPAGLAVSGNLQVSVTPVNDAPVIKEFAAVTFAEDAVYPLNLLGQADDRDDTPQQLTWTLSGSKHVKGTAEGRTMRISAAPDWNGGPETVTLTVTDRGGLSASTRVSVTVTPVNDAPRFSKRGTVTCYTDTSASFDLKTIADDPESGAAGLKWSAVTGANVDASVNGSGILTVKPKLPKWRGEETVQITATDPEGAAAAGSVLVKVVKGRRR